MHSAELVKPSDLDASSGKKSKRDFEVSATDVELFTTVILAHVTISLTKDLLVDHEL